MSDRDTTSALLTHQIDARKKLCPVPVIKLQNAMKQLTAGQQVRLLATDPGVLQDVPAWCRVHGHRILESQSRDGEHVFLVEAGD